MQNYNSTIMSQYTASPRIDQLITNFNSYIDPASNLTAFFNVVWNIETAQGYGLDVWGRIVGVNRIVPMTTGTYFGFEGTGNQPFGSASFWAGTPVATGYALTDAAFRQLILVKAFSNISRASVPALNAMLMDLFPGRGNCYVSANGGMNTRLTFEFLLEPFEIALLKYSNAFATPTGVQTEIMTLDLPFVFGFAEAGPHAAPFNCLDNSGAQAGGHFFGGFA